MHQFSWYSIWRMFVEGLLLGWDVNSFASMRINVFDPHLTFIVNSFQYFGKILPSTRYMQWVAQMQWALGRHCGNVVFPSGVKFLQLCSESGRCGGKLLTPMHNHQLGRYGSAHANPLSWAFRRQSQEETEVSHFRSDQGEPTWGIGWSTPASNVLTVAACVQLRASTMAEPSENASDCRCVSSHASQYLQRSTSSLISVT